MSTEPCFEPLPGQADAAVALVAAMAYERTVRPIVEGYKRAILEKHAFHIAEKWVAMGAPDRVILDPQRSYLLNKEDSAVYYRECAEGKAQSGLVTEDPDACPLLVAEGLRIKCENELLQTWEGHPKFSVLAKTWALTAEQRQKAIDLTLKLLGPSLAAGAAETLSVILHERGAASEDTAVPGCTP